VQQFGTPSAIYDTPVNTFVATFMGSPSMNLLPAVARLQGGGAPQLQVEGSQALIRLPEAYAAAALTEGQTVLLGLRPEWFSHQSAPTPSQVTLTAALDVLEPTGPDLYAALRIGGHEVMARLPADTAVRAGSEVAFQVDLSKAQVFDRASGINVQSAR
jgi:multiple sugar transport system ATP-binding protein